MKNRLFDHGIELILAIPLFPLFVINIFLPGRYRFRISSLHSSRIGHYGADFLIRLAELSTRQLNVRVLHVINEESCNQFLDKLVQRQLYCLRHAKWLLRLSKSRLLRKRLYINSPNEKTGSRDLLGVTRLNIHKLFSDEENRVAHSWLYEHGWKGPNQRIVCLLNRDGSYLEKAQSGKDWSHHDYRNTDISTYRKAVQWLTKENDCFVLRMGQLNSERLDIASQNFVDYSFCLDKSDFMDIWLFCNCNFFLSQGTGPDIISSYLNIPGVYVNFLPYAHAPSFTNSLVVPKKLWSCESKKYLDFQSCLIANYLDTSQYHQDEIKVIDLTEEEVFLATKYGWRYLIDADCSGRPTVLQDATVEYLNIVKKDYSFLHGYISANFNFSIFV